jgi:glycosyltransferase involved in cell wall biosynthesis
VVILTSDLGGGTGNHMLGMMRYWDKADWTVEIVSTAPRTTHLVPDVPVSHLPQLNKLRRFPFVQIAQFVRIRRFVKHFKPHLVHAYFFWPIIYARLLKQGGLVPHVIENREDQGFGWGKSEYSMLRRTRRTPDAIICVSEGVREVLLQREAVDEQKTCVVRNGVEVNEPHQDGRSSIRSRLGLGPEHLLVGMVANFNRPVKGVTYFLDAIPLILRANPAARFIIIGEGNEKPALMAKAERLGIANTLTFAGYCTNVLEHYAAMDVSVLTSLSEGLSITLLESMSLSLPIVATHVGGNPEIVVDGQTGYLVPPRDPEAFSARVVELLSDSSLRARMGAAGRQRIEQHFRIQNVAAKYLQVYEKTCGRMASGKPGGILARSRSGHEGAGR